MIPFFLTFLRRSTSPPQRISWFEPRWSHIPRRNREFRKYFGGQAGIRIVIASLVIGATMVLGAWIAFPLIQIPPLWRMLAPILAIFGYLWFIPIAIPTWIEIKKEHLHRINGKSQWILSAERILRTRIVVYAKDRVRLRVFYQAGERTYSSMFGVSSKVDLETLRSLLPVAPEVWDAQARYSQRTTRRNRNTDLRA